MSEPIPIKYTERKKVKAGAGVKAVVEVDAPGEFAQSHGYDTEVRGISIPEPNLESLQNR